MDNLILHSSLFILHSSLRFFILHSSLKFFTPEGTRSLNPEWKKGAYYIALKAQIPLLLYGVDYEKREIVCTKSFIPTGDIDNEMRELKLYYKDFKGKHPELFTIGEV